MYNNILSETKRSWLLHWLLPLQHICWIYKTNPKKKSSCPNFFGCDFSLNWHCSIFHNLFCKRFSLNASASNGLWLLPSQFSSTKERNVWICVDYELREEDSISSGQWWLNCRTICIKYIKRVAKEAFKLKPVNF